MSKKRMAPSGERAFEELRRRTKLILRFFDERSCLKLAYAELLRAGQRSRSVRMSDIELRQLQMLRAELAQERGQSRCSSSPTKENVA